MSTGGSESLKRPRLLDWCTAALFTVLIGVILLQVFFRYVLGSALGWTEELCKLLFVWLVFVGTAAALRDKMHIRVTALIDFLPKPLQAVADVFSAVLEVAFLGGVCWLGIRMTVLMAGTRSPALHFPVSLQYAALPAACVAGIAYAVWHAVQSVKARRASGEEDAAC